MHWGVAAVMISIILIIVIVNATRIESLRQDLNSQSSDFVLPEIESMLIRGEGGERVPKRAYWVTIHPESNPSSDPEELTVSMGDNSGDTDGQALDNDVGRRFIRYVYRPDQRIVFSIERSGNKLLVSPVSSAAVRLTPAGMVEPRKLTLIGTPEGLITSTAGAT